jgi:hypothetical protein
MNTALFALELVVAGGGAFLLVRSVRGALRSFQQPFGPERNISWMASFRRFMLGAALVGVAASLLFDVTWLLLLSLAIGGEEVLESTLLLDGLRRGPNIRIHP